MKEITITLTVKEIELIQEALSTHRINRQNYADHLAEHNKTGINTKTIERNRRVARECNTLFGKLYDNIVNN